jgi:hypothetical protein
MVIKTGLWNRQEPGFYNYFGRAIAIDGQI